MASALFTAVACGIVGTSLLFHVGQPFLAIVVGLVAYGGTRWIFLNYP